MFGRTVKIDGLEIHVSCTPSTPLWDVLRRAADQVKSWQTESDYQAQGPSIAFRHNITVARS
jgi:hypothetical protein